MIKLALVGKKISHSKSPEIYQGLIGDKLDYQILDFANETDIPTAKELLSIFKGISITSPYKKHFINEVELIDDAIELKSINCMRLKNGYVEGVNTDYLAIVDILKKYLAEDLEIEIAILGDGVMSQVTQTALKKLMKNFVVFSRKANQNFSEINIPDYFGCKKVLIINTCSRDFIYSNNVKSDYIFWDFNYSFSIHEEKLSSQCTYVDGLSLLALQAEYALHFWSINKKVNPLISL